jgi:hypothetical protein
VELVLNIFLFFFRIFDFESAQSKVDAPEITFRYLSQVDQFACPISQFIAGKKISFLVDESKSGALVQKLPALQKAWSEQGSELFRETSRILNSSFGYQKHKTGVFFCETIPSWGFPRIVRVNTNTKAQNQIDHTENELFIDTVFHEHLHLLVYRLLKWKLESPMLVQYRNEDVNTRGHLHLFAIQKMVYENLNRGQSWNKVLSENQRTDKSYRRAMEIIYLEGADKFIEEIKISK